MANENFKKALYDALIPEYVAVMRNADDTIHVFSPKFERKMFNLIRRRKKAYYSLINTLGKRVACIVVIILVASSVTVVSVRALREAVANFFVDVYEKFSTIQSENKENAPETIEDIYEITYDLSDYKIDFEDYTNYSRSIIYGNDDISINYKQYTKNMFNNNMNTENAEISEMNIGNYEVIYFQDNNGYDCFIWDNGDYIFMLCSNIGKNILIEMAKSVQKVEN